MELPKIEIEKQCDEQILGGKDREVFFYYNKFDTPITLPKGDVE